MRIFLLAMLACAGCADRTPGSVPTSTSEAVTTAPGSLAASTAALPLLPKAERLEATRLRSTLGCGRAVGACQVLAQFDQCVPFQPVTASGEGRWMGLGFRVKGGVQTEEITLLRTRAVPSSQVGAGALPALVSIEAMEADREGEKRNAMHAVRAFARGDVPLPTNTAIRYVKERTQWSESPVLSAEDHQLYVATSGGGHLCARSDQRLVVVRRDKDPDHAGDGVYAIVWPVSW